MKDKTKGVNTDQLTENSSVLSAIEEFIETRERIAEEWDDEFQSIPITIRLDTSDVAILDYLVERWKENRSSVASKMLNLMLRLTFDLLHKDKTKEERNNLYSNLWNEFYDKMETKKKKQKNKGEKKK